MKARILLILLFSTIANVYAQDTLNKASVPAKDLQPLSAEQAELLKTASFTDIEGKTYSLKDFKGKAVVLHFWEKNAGRSVKSMDDLYRAQDMNRNDVVVIAVNVQSVDKLITIKNFAEENIYSFIYVPDNKLTQSLAIQKIPYKVFFDREGNLVSSFSGAYPDVREFRRNQELIEKCLGKQ